MKTGKVFQELSVNDGRKVVLRTPRWEDLDDLLELVNSLVDEAAEIYRDEKASRDEEIDWRSGVLARLEEGKTFFLVAEVDGGVVASSDVNGQRAYEKHVGVVGIIVRRGFRDLGIGTAMMRVLLEQAQETGLKVLTLSAFASNKRAIHVYENVGFVQTGFIPRKHLKEGKYTDEVIMTKLLE
ncbi:MAG: GNAT family N-acetyltransferase [Candidatus Bathyarchaeia archaeon]|jgi:RimJ/RimL family protein N-acetyltransferase